MIQETPLVNPWFKICKVFPSYNSNVLAATETEEIFQPEAPFLQCPALDCVILRLGSYYMRGWYFVYQLPLARDLAG